MADSTLMLSPCGNLSLKLYLKKRNGVESSKTLHWDLNDFLGCVNSMQFLLRPGNLRKGLSFSLTSGPRNNMSVCSSAFGLCSSSSVIVAADVLGEAAFSCPPAQMWGTGGFCLEPPVSREHGKCRPSLMAFLSSPCASAGHDTILHLHQVPFLSLSRVRPSPKFLPPSIFIPTTFLPFIYYSALPLHPTNSFFHHSCFPSNPSPARFCL